MISVQEAKELLQARAPHGSAQFLPLSQALGRTLAADMHACIDVPSFDNSAMDGYALALDGRTCWEITTLVPAGARADALPELLPGQAARIYTGAPIPPGADTIIPQEVVQVEGAQLSYLQGKLSVGANIRRRGAQSEVGDLVLQVGNRLTPGTIGLLASVGVAQVPVYAPPVVSCLTTGDELVEVGEGLLPGQIYDSNGPALLACLQQLGIVEVHLRRVPDTLEALQQAMQEELQRADVLLLTGGISVGDYDFGQQALEAQGVQQLFYKVKQRPGKPLYAGMSGGKWVFALPGNPASVLSCFYQYVRPCLRTWMGEVDVWEPDGYLPLLEAVGKVEGLTFFLKGQRLRQGMLPVGAQQSFDLSAFAFADCLMELPEGQARVEIGTLLPYYNL